MYDPFIQYDDDDDDGDYYHFAHNITLAIEDKKRKKSTANWLLNKRFRLSFVLFCCVF